MGLDECEADGLPRFAVVEGPFDGEGCLTRLLFDGFRDVCTPYHSVFVWIIYSLYTSIFHVFADESKGILELPFSEMTT